MALTGEDQQRGSSPSFFRRQGEVPSPRPAPGLAAGKLVGDFELVGLLGQGGMGQVWEAEQRALKRRVAVKFVRPERVTPHQLELFAREARAGGRLSHPGIVAVYGHGEADGLAWIALEFVGGAWTLKDFLDDVARGGELPPGYDRHVARFVAEIAEALQAAHDANVIHRDLKPQNVLITSDDHPKVTDFGLARITDETALSVTGDFAGTYLYMSPEQAMARRMGLDHRTDVFSLGVVLYELLALRRPFEGDTTQQVAEQIVTKDPPDPRTIRSKVPRDLAVIANHALEKEREKRYQTMREFAADLRRFLANEPIQATPPTSLDRALKWMKRNPGKSSAAALVSVAAAAITALLFANVRTNAALSAERTKLGQANTSLEAKTEESERRRTAAEQEKERADREAQAATKRADEVMRLSALQKLDDLLAAADRLWPAYPQNIAPYETWLARAQELVSELPVHEAQLAALRAKARPARAHEPATDGEWIFDDALDKWWHNQLEKLVSGLKALADEDTGLFSRGLSAEHGWGVMKRLESAGALADGFAAGGEYERAWSAASAELRAAYPRLALTPQLGLVPLGPDPDSGLWEFAELQTGEPAVRGADGRLALSEATGLVLVLLPGGTFQMGAQRSDPDGANYDPHAAGNEGPVHAVRLSPFFLSKYEMTQAQWLRFTGRNPSGYAKETKFGKRSLLHPVEQVTWMQCLEVTTRLGLTLPSEAQWEYGCRGGSSTPWWTGAERESLRGSVNLADQTARKGGATWADIQDWPELEDGWIVHAAVGSFAANPFGLHEVHGNVWEWCLDGYDRAALGRSTTEDPVTPWTGASNRVVRGGSFHEAASIARSAHRDFNTPEYQDFELGLRPARALTTGAFTPSPASPR